MSRLANARYLVVLLGIIFFSAGASWAQTSGLTGTIVDPSGATVVGAQMELTNEATNGVRGDVTDSDGKFHFSQVPPGKYRLEVKAQGFKTTVRAHLELLVGTTSSIEIKLAIGVVSETMIVEAQAAPLNTTDASIGTPISGSELNALPVLDSNPAGLLSLQPGVPYIPGKADNPSGYGGATDQDGRSGSVNGARSDQTNVTLDGVDVNDAQKGYAFTSVLRVPQESLAEFRTTTTSYDADSGGRSSAAQVQLVTKSGTNSLHGSAYYSHRNEAFNANDFFLNRAGIKEGKFRHQLYGASLGGPVIKDRVFLFGNFERLTEALFKSAERNVPSAAFKDGVFFYQCRNGAGFASCTPPVGGFAQGVSGASYGMDANGQPCRATDAGCGQIQQGFYALNPAQIAGLDPLGIGPNPAVLQYDQQFPDPNSSGTDDGLNILGYRFAAPVNNLFNTAVVRADVHLDRGGKHTVFWRGSLMHDTVNVEPQFPGETARQSNLNNNKGFSVGYTAVLRSTLVNNFRWGFTRQSFGQNGNQTDAIIFFRGLNDNSTPNNSSLGTTNNINYQVPVHNFVDDVSWIKGNHTLQFGANVNFLRNPQANNVNSFSTAFTNASWFDTAGLAGFGAGHFDPAFEGFPAVSDGFVNDYDYPMIALVGMVDQVNAQYNFDHSGNALPQGQPVARHFAADTWEFYAQDSWKIRPTLTLTYGLRYSLFSPPWETNGLQVGPNVSLSDWFAQREAGMLQGIPSSAAPRISFNLNGPANNASGFYNWDKKNFAPRVALAWSPRPQGGLMKALFGESGKSVVRAGFGMVYDRLGPALLATFDASGAFGLSTTLTNTGGVQTPASAPRITGLTGLANLPTTDLDGNTIFAPSPGGSFPQTFPSGLNGDVGSYAVYFGMDDKIKTPYSYTLDFSIGRELGHNFSLDVSYVGRLSHRLMTQSDLAMPLDLVDPQTGIDYFTAVKALANIYRSGVSSNDFTPAMLGPTASYWSHLMGTTAFLPGSQGFRVSRCVSSDPVSGAPQVFGTTDPVVAAYDLFCGFGGNETTALQGIDQGFGFRDFSAFDPDGSRHPYYPTTGPYTFVDPQFAAIDAWRSLGSASYHALQVSLRKHLSHGVQFDLNYTYSKSIDLSSDANRIQAYGGLGGQVINSWSPKGLRGVSDFDTTHQINANWIAELPFGKGKPFGRDSHGAVEAIIGGWQLTGLARWTSGFPVGVSNGAQWPTNWELSGFARLKGQAPSTHTTKNPDGSVNIFGNSTAADAAFAAFDTDFPGEVGNRNVLRGDGFASLDLGLSKRWKMPYSEAHSLQFRWDVFNALNLTRFDTSTLSLSLTNQDSFGNYGGLLTNPRVMQFALRYEF